MEINSAASISTPINQIQRWHFHLTEIWWYTFHFTVIVVESKVSYELELDFDTEFEWIWNIEIFTMFQ